MDPIFKPTDKFELLKKWEASRFASPTHPVDHVPQDIPLATQRQMFHPIMELEDWYAEACMPRLYFEGRTPNWIDSEPVHTVAGWIAGQYETPDGYLVIIADNDPALFRNNDAKLSWKMSIQDYADWKCVLGARSIVVMLYFDKDLKPIHWVLLNASWLISYPKSYGRNVPEGTMYLYPAVENIWNDGNKLTLNLFQECQITVKLCDSPKFKPFRKGGKGGNVHANWTPFTEWFNLDRTLVQTNSFGSAPIEVRINSWRSIRRILKRRWKPKPRLEDFEVIDPEKGYLNYKAGEED